jgi:hypothetical protein
MLKSISAFLELVFQAPKTSSLDAQTDREFTAAEVLSAFSN